MQRYTAYYRCVFSVSVIRWEESLPWFYTIHMLEISKDLIADPNHHTSIHIDSIPRQHNIHVCLPKSSSTTLNTSPDTPSREGKLLDSLFNGFDFHWSLTTGSQCVFNLKHVSYELLWTLSHITYQPSLSCVHTHMRTHTHIHTHTPETWHYRAFNFSWLSTNSRRYLFDRGLRSYTVHTILQQIISPSSITILFCWHSTFWTTVVLYFF